MCVEVVSGRKYILLEDRLSSLFKTDQEYIVVEKITGQSLVGNKYLPLFPYFADLKSTNPNQGAFRIVRCVCVCVCLVMVCVCLVMVCVCSVMAM